MIVLMWLVLTGFVGYYAHCKGKDWVKAVLAALFLSPLFGFIVVALLKDTSEHKALLKAELKKCPACAELVKNEALKCKHCGENLCETKSVAGLRNLVDNIKTDSNSL